MNNFQKRLMGFIIFSFSFFVVISRVNGGYLSSPLSSFSVNSWVDHSTPEYNGDRFLNRMTRYDGLVFTGSGVNILNCTLTVNCYDGHDGIDLRALLNTPVFAAANGVVTTGFSNSGGFWLRIWHSAQGYSSYYGHLNSYVVTGGSVVRGQLVAYSGNSGSPGTGYHLHFGVYNSQTSWLAIDPFGWKGTTTLSGWIGNIPWIGTTTDPWPYNRGYLWTTDPPSLKPPATYVSGVISQNTTWKSGNVYVVQGGVTVNPGVTLTVEPGTIVKFDSNASISLTSTSTLSAIGNPKFKIYFTSFKDDSVGGDTNGDGNATSPAPRDYYGLYFYQGGTGSFDNAVIKYAGIYYHYGAIKVLGGNVSVKNSEISRNLLLGVYIDSGSLLIDSSVIKDNGNYGIFASVSTSTPIMVTNTAFGGHSLSEAYFFGPIDFVNSGNSAFGTSTSRGFVIGGYLSSNQIWNPGIPFIPSSFFVSAGKNLTISPGTIVKFPYSVQIQSLGTLNAQATSQNKIYFTSLKDDSVGGDTNGDGNATSPGPGDYSGLYFYQGGTGLFDNTVIKYAGYYYSYYGAINVLGGNVSVKNTKIVNNLRGIYGNSGNINISYSFIHNNTDYGVYNIQSPLINATNNFWGDASGPYHPTQNPSGKGDRVSDNVNFRPWLTYDPTQDPANPCPGC